MTFDLAFLIGGCFVAAFCSGLAGFSFNLIGAAILYHVLPPQTLAPVLVLGSLLIQAGTIRPVRASCAPRCPTWRCTSVRSHPRRSTVSTGSRCRRACLETNRRWRGRSHAVSPSWATSRSSRATAAR
jgi:hypothetical protein